MRLTAIDFETANNASQSACSIGIVVFEDGMLIYEECFLIKPQRYYSQFSPFNITIHHITPEMVRYAPEFDQVFPKLLPWLDNAVVVAHNAPFDIAVLRSLIQLYGLETPIVPYIDSVEVARKCYPRLDNHKLNTVCSALEIELDHHDALSDARGSALIIMNALAVMDEYDPQVLMNCLNLRYKKL